MLSEQRVVEILVHSICGGIAGGFSQACSYPFTYIRLRRIAEDLKKLKKSETINELNDNTNFYNEQAGIIKFTINLINSEGVLSLFDGVTSSVIGSMNQYAIYFCASKFWSYTLDNLNINSFMGKSITINLLSSICSSILNNPFSVINARMANRNKKENNIGNFEMVKLIYREAGLSGFFKGITPSIFLSIVPVIQFTFYEFFEIIFKTGNGKITNKEILIASSISKFLAVILSYPIMSLKTLYQSSDKSSTESVSKLILKILKEEGIFGLYKGFAPKIVGSMFDNFVLMITYVRLQNIVRMALSKLIFGKYHSKISNS